MPRKCKECGHILPPKCSACDDSGYSGVSYDTKGVHRTICWCESGQKIKERENDKPLAE